MKISDSVSFSAPSRILYHHRIASKDGQFVHVEEIITAMKKKGHDVLLVAPSINENAQFGHDGGWVSSLKKSLPKFIYEMLELTYSTWLFVKLIRAIIKFKPDFIYERYNLYQPAGILASKLMRVPLILEINAPLFEERSRYSGGIAIPWLAKSIERFTWKNATFRLPVTDVLRKIIEMEIGSNKGTHVLHNGVREDASNNEIPDAPSEDNDIIVGFVGFMHLTCGVEHVISLMAENPSLKIKLICIGDGPRADALQKMTADLGLSHKAEFTGLIHRDSIFDKIKTFHIALQPAVTAYASPLKMFEYMAAGNLIVAPQQPNIMEILDRQCAILFQPGNPESLKEALYDAVVNYREHQEKRSAAQMKITSSKFTWENNVDTITGLIKGLKR